MPSQNAPKNPQETWRNVPAISEPLTVRPTPYSVTGLGQPEGSTEIPRLWSYEGEEPESITSLKAAYWRFVAALNNVTAPMPVHDLTAALGRWLGVR